MGRKPYCWIDRRRMPSEGIGYSGTLRRIWLNRMIGQMGTAAIMEAQRAPNQTLRMALVVMIVVPIACAYPFFQRYIVAGLTIGSVKG